MEERITNNYSENNVNSIQILEYKQEYAKHFKTLNLEWLTEHFVPEESDLDILSNPENHIIKQKGQVFFIQDKNRIIGILFNLVAFSIFDLFRTHAVHH